MRIHYSDEQRAGELGFALLSTVLIILILIPVVGLNTDVGVLNLVTSKHGDIHLRSADIGSDSGIPSHCVGNPQAGTVRQIWFRERHVQ
jgi:hypothetical protein